MEGISFVLSRNTEQKGKDSPMEALGDVLRPSMLGPSSASGQESRRHIGNRMFQLTNKTDVVLGDNNRAFILKLMMDQRLLLILKFSVCAESDRLCWSHKGQVTKTSKLGRHQQSWIVAQFTQVDKRDQNK